MCTVSFIPLTPVSYLLTSNRDETIARGLASSPAVIEKEGYRILCPLDPLASGTWIAASDNGNVVCLLNGAFKKHERHPPYRKSRGLIVLDYFETGDPEKFAASCDLDQIEPFTMVLVNHRSEIRLFELRWDGNTRHFKPLDETQWHLWSSPTLYENVMSGEKMNVFAEKLKVDFHSDKPESIINIHDTFRYEDWVKSPVRVMEVATLSITSIKVDEHEVTMQYRDLVRNEVPMDKMVLKR